MAKKGKSSFGKSFNKEQNRLGTFKALPAGEYPVIIEKAVEQETKAGDGELLVLTFKVLSGKEKGKTVTNYLCFEHPNEQTSDIAKQHIASICDATDLDFTKLTKTGSKVFQKKKLNVSLTIKADEKYGERNDFSGYFPFKKKGKKSKNSPF